MKATSDARKRYTDAIVETHHLADSAPSPAPAATISSSRPMRYAKTTALEPLPTPSPRLVVAHVDVGWGNTLFIRGEGGGLSWERGQPMSCDRSNLWLWSCAGEDEPRAFKFLINDEIWAEGGNDTMQTSDVTECRPHFSAIGIGV